MSILAPHLLASCHRQGSGTGQPVLQVLHEGFEFRVLFLQGNVLQGAVGKLSKNVVARLLFALKTAPAFSSVRSKLELLEAGLLFDLVGVLCELVLHVLKLHVALVSPSFRLTAAGNLDRPGTKSILVVVVAELVGFQEGALPWGVGIPLLVFRKLV